MLSQGYLTEHGLEVLLEFLSYQILLSFIQSHQAINLAGILLPHESSHPLPIGALYCLASRELSCILCEHLIHLGRSIKLLDDRSEELLLIAGMLSGHLYSVSLISGCLVDREVNCVLVKVDRNVGFGFWEIQEQWVGRANQTTLAPFEQVHLL